MTLINSYPRETIEFQPVTVTVNGTPTTSNIEYAITKGNDRPTDWIPPVVIGDEQGVMVTGLTVGAWRIWARVTSTPEIPVVYCGTINIS